TLRSLAALLQPTQHIAQSLYIGLAIAGFIMLTGGRGIDQIAQLAIWPTAGALGREQITRYRRSEERRVGKECSSGWGAAVSSRRRHTRFSRDWSSDVCSSDLTLRSLAALLQPTQHIAQSLYIGLAIAGFIMLTVGRGIDQIAQLAIWPTAGALGREQITRYR